MAKEPETVTTQVTELVGMNKEAEKALREKASYLVVMTAALLNNPLKYPEQRQQEVENYCLHCMCWAYEAGYERGSQ